MTPHGTQVIQRVATLLRLLSAKARTGMRLVDLEKYAGLERGTAHRLLQGLIAEGFVMQDLATRRYFIGPALFEMGIAAAPHMQLRDICHPFVQTVSSQTEDTAFLMVRSGFDCVCMDRCEGEFPVKAFSVEVGRRRPLGIGTSSIAMLSRLPPEEVQRICTANGERCTEFLPRYSLARLRKQVAAARSCGYASGSVLEVPEIRGVAVAVCDAAGRPLAALGVSAVSSRLTGAREAEVATLLLNAAHQIEAQLAQS